MNGGSPNADLLYEKYLLTLLNSGGGVAFLWYAQVDVAAKDGAELEGRGRRWSFRARASQAGRRGEEARKGKEKDLLVLFIRQMDK